MSNQEQRAEDHLWKALETSSSLADGLNELRLTFPTGSDEREQVNEERRALRDERREIVAQLALAVAELVQVARPTDEEIAELIALRDDVRRQTAASLQFQAALELATAVLDTLKNLKPSGA